MIEQFQDEYRWLSNFWEFDTPMLYGTGYGTSFRFPTNEHFYVAMKVKDFQTRKLIAGHPIKGLKKFGATLELREDWDDIKLDVMLYGLRYKFSTANPTLRQKLLDTGDQQIEEGNWWGDDFWGVCSKSGLGLNHLGRLLMQVRQEIRNETQRDD